MREITKPGSNRCAPAMGQSESSFKRNYQECVSQLSSVQLREITTHFHEVYAKAGGSKGHLVDREAFSKYFKLPVTVGERLFEAFDAHKNGKISFEEFVCGLAVLLHGSFSSKCQLLFQVFNIHGDEGISREELATMLHAILQSTNTIVMAVSRVERQGMGGSAVMEGENREQAIRAMVDSAFRNCDITGTGKLLPLEFEYWVRRHPKILDTLLSFKPHESRGTLAPLLLSPDNQGMSAETTVSVPLHPSPLPPRPPSPLPPHTGSQGSLEVTHTSHLRSIQSEPVFDAMATDMGVLSDEVTMARSDTVAKISSEPVAIEMGASSPTLELEPDTPLQSGTETFTIPESEVKFTTGEKEGDSGEEGSGGNVEGGDDNVVGGERKGEGVEDGEGESEGVESGDKEGGGVKGGGVVGEDRESEGGGVENEEGEGVEGGGVEGGDGRVGEETTDNRQPDQDREDTAAQEVGGGGGEQSGSIMQSQEAFPLDVDLDLPIAPPHTLPYTPSSPLLPTTMETVALEMLVGTEEEVTGEGEIEQPLSLPEISLVGESTPLSMGESEGDVINITSPLTADGYLLEPCEHQLEVTEHQLQDSRVAGVNKLDTPETGTSHSSTSSYPISGVEALSTGAAAPQLSDPLSSSSSVLSHPLQLSPLHSSQPHGEHGEQARSDLGPDPIVFVPPRHPSPFPDVVEGVKESLYTAWIPSPSTQGLLSQPSSITQHHLTCPGLVADIKMHDPISELLVAHFPSAPRKTLPSIESVSMDMTGLRRLVKERCYHTALELTGRFLSAHGQGLGQAGQPSLHTHKTLQMWAARLALLVAMQQYREAEMELASFGDLVNPDLYYQYHTHNYPGKTGSMVPFSMRLLHAQLPSHSSNHQLTLDRLCLLQHTCQEVLSEVRRGYLPFVSEPLTSEDQQAADALWLERLTRVKFYLANTLVAMQDYLLAVEVYESLLDHLPSMRGHLLSVMGRLYLTLGDLTSAQTLFSQAAMSGEGDGYREIRSNINQGLVNVFLCRWQLAKDCFENALQLEPNNLTLRNNVAVCTFYQGHLKECISDMECVVRSSPPSSLQPALFCNLAAAYDLESSSAHSKKLSFLPLLGQHVGEGFPLNSLSVR